MSRELGAGLPGFDPGAFPCNDETGFEKKRRAKIFVPIVAKNLIIHPKKDLSVNFVDRNLPVNLFVFKKVRSAKTAMNGFFAF